VTTLVRVLDSLARWVNAPATGLQLVWDNLILNHNVSYLGIRLSYH